MQPAASVLSAWSVFYTLTGTSAAALTGLTFVIITLIGGSDGRTFSEGIWRVSTATVAHFAVSLMISAALCAPWPALACPALILAIAGIFGVSYQCRLLVFTLRNVMQHNVEPDLEDWMWYQILPTLAYALLLAAGIMLTVAPSLYVYAPAAAVALLIVIGIHNSWDLVTYITTGSS